MIIKLNQISHYSKTINRRWYVGGFALVSSSISVFLPLSIHVTLTSFYSHRPSSSLTSTSSQFQCLFPALHLSLYSSSSSRAAAKPPCSLPAEFIHWGGDQDRDLLHFSLHVFIWLICTSFLSSKHLIWYFLHLKGHSANFFTWKSVYSTWRALHSLWKQLYNVCCGSVGSSAKFESTKHKT